MHMNLEAKRLGNCRLRYHINGIVHLSKDDPDAMAYLDEVMFRLPNQKAWRPRCCFDENRNVRELKPHFGQHAFIVGKGTSADKLTQANFPVNDPVIGLNEAFMFLEELGISNKIFGIRQDCATGVTMPAKTTTLLINDNILPIYANYPHTYVFNAKPDFGITHACASVVVAVGFAKAMGVTKLTMYGFDSYTVGSVEYDRMSNCRNDVSDNLHLLKQKDQFRYLDTTGMVIRWVTPDLDKFLTIL